MAALASRAVIDSLKESGAQMIRNVPPGESDLVVIENIL